MSDTIVCSACQRSISICIGEAMCERAALGFAQTQGVPMKHCRPLKPYTVSPPLRPGGRVCDYRADALSRDPDLTVRVERMSGSWGLAHVIRNRVGYQITHAEDEALAWAGASGATSRRDYDPDFTPPCRRRANTNE